MRIGLFHNAQSPAGTSASTLADDLIAQTRAARDAGFESVMSGQHYLSDYVQLQNIPLLGRLAAEAEGMTLGTGVVLLPLHHPVEIAEHLATLDAIADDFVAGVGAGYRDAEFAAFGVPKRERAGRLEEGMALLERLWTEERVTFDGEYYSVEDASISTRPPEKPPLWLAANADRAVRRAAERSDAWFVNPHSSMGEIREQKRDIYDPIRRERGADTTVPMIRETFVAPTAEEAYETAREYLEPKYQRYIDWGQDEAMEDETDLHRSFDELAEDRFLIGTPEDVAAELERYEEEVGVDHTLFRVKWPGMDSATACECIELVGDEVVPYV
jgi:alkanesulfonate monooxygenase SsuD/methylene tetrahydromethanopterin reductase-like flavin-dependent oxidoreductase (luciferase family)